MKNPLLLTALGLVTLMAASGCSQATSTEESAGSAATATAASWTLEATAPPQPACDPHTSCPPIFSFSATTVGDSTIVFGAKAYAYANGTFQALYDEPAEPMLGAGSRDVYGLDSGGIFHWNGATTKRVGFGIGEPFDASLLRDPSGAFLVSVRSVDSSGYGHLRLLRVVWDGVSDTPSDASEITCNGERLEPYNMWSSGQDLLVRDGEKGWVHLNDGVCTRLGPNDFAGEWHMDIVGTSMSSLWATEHETLEHFDGTAWKVVANAPAGNPNHLIGSLVVLGPQDIWTGLSPEFGTSAAPSVGHWNGTSLDVIPLPAATPSNGGTHVFGTDSDHLWAITGDGKIYRFHH